MKKIIFIFLTFITINGVFADSDSKDYKALSELMPSINNKEKIEVVEFMWYGCGTCYLTEQTLKEWLKTKPDYVDFIKVPAVVGINLWDFHAKFFTTLQLMNKEEELREYIFDAILNKKNNLDNINKLKDFVKGFQIDPEEFEKAFNSFAVEKQLEKYKDLTVKYNIFSTPSIFVNGKYQAVNNSNLIQTLNSLSEKEFNNSAANE